MTLEESKKLFEINFKVIRRHHKYEENPKLPLICSGGTCKVGDVYPCLFSSEERAIAAWLDTAESVVSTKATTLDWILPPEVMEFQMTMADMRNQHRLVTKRWAVKSQFITSGPKMLQDTCNNG